MKKITTTQYSIEYARDGSWWMLITGTDFDKIDEEVKRIVAKPKDKGEQEISEFAMRVVKTTLTEEIEILPYSGVNTDR